MKNWWQSLSIASKLNLPIQAILLVMLSLAHFWIIDHFQNEILDAAERRAEVSADGIINGMNMLMVTGMISNPDHRRLFIRKMGDTLHIKELRIIRAQSVQQQFGPGLPEEQARDEMDARVIKSKKTQFQLDQNHASPTLRVVVPFIASSNFRGTNCLSCHHVEAGTVNGAASITIDMSEDFTLIEQTRMSLLAGQFALQILLFFSISWLIQRFLRPIEKMQISMETMQSMASMESFMPIETASGGQDKIARLIGVYNQMSLALRDSERSMRLASAIYQSNANAIAVTDEHNRIVDINPAFTRLTGYMLDEIRGQDPKIMKSGRHDAQFYQAMWHSLGENGHWQGEIWDKRKDGEIYAKLVNIISLRNEDGSVYRYVAQFSDITEKKEQENLVQWQANYDPLTSLPNRRLFRDRLKQAIKHSNRSRLPLAVLFIDLDHFKEINDNLGHAVGDTLLMEAAQRMSSCVREADTVARLAGDEFTIILPELSDLKQIDRIAASVVEQLAQSFNLFLSDENNYLISASIGVAVYPTDANDMEQLLKCADKAMYAAKAAGRNRYIHYSDLGESPARV
ncbi:MAG: diguanylate cyclase [Gallionella sp.]|nr:diguanylate cyclase [Gallionella sp.]MDD4945971.1 diguanylate cyclase [Gallionella sp.]